MDHATNLAANQNVIQCSIWSNGDVHHLIRIAGDSVRRQEGKIASDFARFVKRDVADKVAREIAVEVNAIPLCRELIATIDFTTS